MSRTDEELRATLDRISKERATMKPGEYPEEQPTPPMTKTQEMEAERDSLQVQLHLKSDILELEIDARRRAEAERDALQRKLDLHEAFVSFVHRWAVVKSGGAEKRLSAIAYHPAVQALSGRKE